MSVVDNMKTLSFLWDYFCEWLLFFTRMHFFVFKTPTNEFKIPSFRKYQIRTFSFIIPLLHFVIFTYSQLHFIRIASERCNGIFKFPAQSITDQSETRRRDSWRSHKYPIFVFASFVVVKNIVIKVSILSNSIYRVFEGESIYINDCK